MLLSKPSFCGYSVEMELREQEVPSPFILTYSCVVYAAFEIFKTYFRTGEPFQQLGVSIAFTEDPNSILNTRVWQLTTSSNI